MNLEERIVEDIANGTGFSVEKTRKSTATFCCLAQMVPAKKREPKCREHEAHPKARHNSNRTKPQEFADTIPQRAGRDEVAAQRKEALHAKRANCCPTKYAFAGKATEEQRVRDKHRRSEHQPEGIEGVVRRVQRLGQGERVLTRGHRRTLIPSTCAQRRTW